MTETLRIAAVQMRSGTSAQPNLEAITDFVGEAAAAGAQYILTPEVSVVFARDRAGLETEAGPHENNPAIAHCAALAKKYQVFLHLGSMAVALPDQERFANRSLVFDPNGDIVAQYDKIHRFDADPPNDRPYRESNTYIGGDKAQLADIGDVKLGLSVCYDVRFPELYAVLAEAGAEFLAVPAAFTVPTGQAHWEILLRARAIETGSYVVAAAQGGTHENGRATYGHSMIIDPWGKIIAESDDDAPGIIYAEIDPKAVADARARLPVLANRRPFSLSVNHKLSR